MTKRQLLRNLDSYELTEWEAYFAARKLEEELDKSMEETKGEVAQ